MNKVDIKSFISQIIRYIRAKRKILFLVLRIVFTLLIIGFLLLKVDFNELAGVLAAANLIWIIPIILLRPLFYFIRGLKVWQILKYGADLKISMFRVIGWYFMSCSIGVFTPAGVGDFSLSYFAKKHRISISQSSGAIFLDKVINIFFMCCIAFIGIHIYFTIKPIVYMLLGLGLALATGLIVLIVKNRDGFKQYLKNRWTKFIPGIKTIFQFIFKHPLNFIVIIILTLLQNLIVAIQLYLSLYMVNHPSAFLSCFWISSIGRLTTLVPITIGGLGIYEGSMTYLLKQIKVPANFGLTATLIGRTITWTFSFLVIIWLLWFKKNISIRSSHAD